MNTNGCIIIFSTFSSFEEAKNTARQLICKDYAACVNILPKIFSIYKWESNVEESSECMLMIKARKNNYKKIEAFILDNHTYKLPEIIYVDIRGGSPEYLNWLNKK